MPVLGPRVFPDDLVLGLHIEECVADAKTMMAAEFQKPLPILVHPFNDGAEIIVILFLCPEKGRVST